MTDHLPTPPSEPKCPEREGTGYALSNFRRMEVSPPAPDPQGGELPDATGDWHRDGAKWEITIRPDGSGRALCESLATFRAWVSRIGMEQCLPRGGWLPAPAASPPPAAAVTGELPSGLDEDSLERANADYHALESELSSRDPVGYSDYFRLLNCGPEFLEELRSEWKRLRMAIAGHFGPDSLADYSPVAALERACNIAMRQHWQLFVSVPAQPQAEASERQFSSLEGVEILGSGGAGRAALADIRQSTEIDALTSRCESAEAERDRLKEALAFYANPESYDSDHSPGSYVGSPSGRDLWKVDGGTIARKALEFKHEQR